MNFWNAYDEVVYIQDFVDPRTKKTYMIHTHSLLVNKGPLLGMLASEVYLTNQDLNHDILVCIARKAFFPDEIQSYDDLLEKMQVIIESRLDEGIAKFEEILEFGIIDDDAG